MAEIVRCTGDDRNDVPHIERAAAIIRGGSIIAIPTETVYGLAANALDSAAIAKIYEAKGRPLTNPLIVHVTSLEQAKALSSMWPPIADKLARKFWPGPLTLVVPKTDDVPDAVTAGLPTVAIRCPSHPIMRAVIEVSGCPLAAPSANASEQISPTRAEHVQKSLGDTLELILDAGPTEHGLESTVVDCTQNPPRILRHGPITTKDVEAVVGNVDAAEESVDPDTARASPGMSKRHYAPKARLVLSDANHIADLLSSAEKPVGALLISSELQNSSVTIVQMPPHPAAYGAVLFAELHRMDDSGVKTIVVEMPPREPGWEAVLDRLKRASA